ncbi:MAG: transporter protein [Deltaproteobacteria bacterium]|nr:transporter protein [Deltaproteobacteria bacterium]
MEIAIEITDLTYLYPTGNKALDNINLSISRGERIALVGPNGAGKSTLILHLNGILNGVGHLKVMGMPMEKGNLPKIRQKVGVVFQDPDHQLFSPTVFDDVAFGPINMGLSEEDVNTRVSEALEKVGLAGFEERLPHRMSFGEKRRVCIASVLSMSPEILVLDEPSSSLDPRSRRELINLLNSFEITQIIATHDLEMALELCKRVVVMDRGTVVADGDIREILGKEDLMLRHGLEVPHSIRFTHFHTHDHDEKRDEHCHAHCHPHHEMHEHKERV